MRLDRFRSVSGKLQLIYVTHSVKIHILCLNYTLPLLQGGIKFLDDDIRLKKEPIQICLYEGRSIRVHLKYSKQTH